MSDAVIRLTGRPKIDRDPSGLRKITRTYIVQGSAVTEGNVEDQVFLPYGSPDVEYDDTIRQDLTNGGLTNNEVTGAYLVEQSIAPGQSMNEAVLTRVYQELDASNEPVQIGKDEIIRGANDRLTVTRVYIVKNPYNSHLASGRIGVDNLIISGSTCYLGTVQSKETQVFTEFTEVYFEDGVLSESVNYKYGQYPNHKLETRTLRSVVDIPNPPNSEGPGNGPWFRVDEKEGPGNQDYGQLGKTIRTVVFAKGEGLISEDAEVKGKPPNTVEVTTIKYVTGENGSIPAADIPAFTRRTFEGKEEKDGWELHTIRGVVTSTDNGVVDVKVEYKFGQKPDHKLEVAKAVSYGVPPTSDNVLSFVYPGGDNSSLGPYVLIDEREDTTGEFDVFTSSFARGNGVISETEKKVGFALVTETVSLHPMNPPLSSDIGASELTRKVEKLDGYQKLSVSTTTEDSGIVEDKLDTKNNGALQIRTLMQLGSTWTSDTPDGFTEISVKNHRYDIYPAITKIFAKGTGLVSTNKRKEGRANLVTTVRLFPAETALETDTQANELSRKVDEQDGYKILTVTKTDEEESLIDDKLEERHNGALQIITRTALGETWNAVNTPAGFVEVSNRVHTYKEFVAITKVFAKGSGTIQTGSREDGLFVIDKFVVLSASGGTMDEDGDLPTNPEEGQIQNIPARAINIITTQEEGYVKTEYELKNLQEAKENSGFEYGTGVKRLTRSKLNEAYPLDKASGARSIKWLDTKNYLGSSTDVEPTLFQDSSVSWGGGVIKTTSTVIEKGADATAALASISKENGYAIQQIAADVFKKTTTSVEPADFESKDVSVGGGIKRVRESSIGGATSPGEHGGSSEQISFRFYKNSIVNVTEAGLYSKFTSYGSGVKTITETKMGKQAAKNAGGSFEEVASGIFKSTTKEVKAADYFDQTVSWGTGFKTTRTTEIGSEGSSGALGGKKEEVAEGLTRGTTIENTAVPFLDTSVSQNKWYKLVKTTGINTGTTAGNLVLGGSDKEVSEGLNLQESNAILAHSFRDRTVTKIGAGAVKKTTSTGIGVSFDEEGAETNVHESLGPVGTNVTYSPGELSGESKTISGETEVTETVSLSQDGSLGDSFGKTTQIAPGFFAKTTKEYALWGDLAGKSLGENVSFSDGLRINSVSGYGDVTASGLSDHGSSEDTKYVPGQGGQATPITKKTDKRATPLTYEDTNVSYGGGVIKTTTRSISSTAQTANPGLSTSAIQISGSLFKNMSESIASAHYEDESYSVNKWFTEKRSTSISGSSVTPSETTGGSSIQLHKDIFRNTTISVTDNSSTESSTSFLSAGALKKTVTTTVGGGAGSYDTSSVPLHPEIGDLVSSTTYEQGELAGESKVIRGGAEITTTTSVTNDSSASNVGESTTQIGPGIFIKKTESGQQWSELDGKEILNRKYYRLGVEFNEVQQYGSMPNAAGTTIEEVTETEIIPSGQGSISIKKCKKTGATFKSASWTTYEARSFEMPGVIKRTKDGVTISRPFTCPIWCKVEHRLTQNPGTLARTYQPPYAFMNFFVVFQGSRDDYVVTGGGQNYVYIVGTTSMPTKGDTFQGSKVLAAEEDKDGTNYASWSPVDKTIAANYSTVYSANGFEVFHEQIVSINTKPVLG